MSSRRRRASVTPEQVKRVWDSFDQPTVRGVMRALQAAGVNVHRDTLKRWVKNNFAPTKSNQTNASIAMRVIDEAMPVLTGRAEVRLHEMIAPLKEIWDARFRSLEDLQDETLIRLHARTMHMVNVLLGEEIIRQREHLVKDLPGEAGTLVRALSDSATAAGDTWTQVFALSDRAMKVQEITAGKEREIRGEIIPPGPQIAGPNIVDPLAFEFAAVDSELLDRTKAARRARTNT